MLKPTILGRIFITLFMSSLFSVAFTQETGTLTDSDDGQSYKIVKIGDQWWMSENLKYYTPEGSWDYNNDSTLLGKYGRLYDWETAKRVCPRGWHLPTKGEYQMLMDAVDDGIRNAFIPLTENNASGFMAQSGGRMNENNTFSDLNINGYYWTSSKDYLGHIWYLNFYSENQNAFFYFSKDMKGLSVRCLKN